MKCRYCGKELIYKFGRPPKYCKDCAEKKKKRQDKHRKYKIRQLGTTPFSEHRKKGFNEEYDEIQKEMKRIKL